MVSARVTPKSHSSPVSLGTQLTLELVENPFFFLLSSYGLR